jgi:hypothetical protein
MFLVGAAYFVCGSYPDGLTAADFDSSHPKKEVRKMILFLDALIVGDVCCVQTALTCTALCSYRDRCRQERRKERMRERCRCYEGGLFKRPLRLDTCVLIVQKWIPGVNVVCVKFPRRRKEL